ncbi:conserved hypothetical integral membrane protein [Kytococcus aerolatus]|uniref:Conserved hypothetical integral membrane protein n=1 Tax=Kytococcus aerolatus TaxID=592308 RepID=A0A212T1Y8_9MICO|nr:conserved hypothetical integral membrane protein [Kytococcus aerolatus]
MATVLGTWMPVVGAPVFGILLGVLVAGLLPAARGERTAPGLAFAAKKVLQASIVVLGLGLSLGQVLRIGGESLPVMLGTLVVALVAAWLLGRWLGTPRDVTTLVGVGTGICGASAIAAASAVIKPRQEDVAYAIGTIFTFNILAVLLFPPLGHALGMDEAAFGLWAGTAINDTSSVVAAAYSYGDEAGPHAVVVKLVRTLMIIPIVLVLAWATARREQGGAERVPLRKVLPTFILLFLLAAALRSLGLVPDAWQEGVTTLGVLLITTALAAIGLTLRVDQVRAAGPRPLLLGGMVWVLVSVSSLGLQALTGTL